MRRRDLGACDRNPSAAAAQDKHLFSLPQRVCLWYILWDASQGKAGKLAGSPFVRQFIEVSAPPSPLPPACT
jgi:hypothetical protein